MTCDQAHILATLERAAAAGDPAGDVYARLFVAHPGLEALFLMDQDGGVRGSMLQNAIDCLIDCAGPGMITPAVMASERQNHVAYGVPDGVFDAFFAAIRDTIAARCGEAWTAEAGAAWARTLDRLAATGHPTG